LDPNVAAEVGQIKLLRNPGNQDAAEIKTNLHGHLDGNLPFIVTTELALSFPKFRRTLIKRKFNQK